MIKHRECPDYSAYMHIQGAKARANAAELAKAFGPMRRGFRGAFEEAKSSLRPGTILCMGARNGAEVAAARDFGFKRAYGIDLHPVAAGSKDLGPRLVRADWHYIPFVDRSFDTVFTNSLDHCQSLDRLCAEVSRILRPKGTFYVRASDSIGKTIEHWERKTKLESLWWDRWPDLMHGICERGFVEVASWQRGKWGAFVLRAKT